jgi:serine/threonine protein kinase
LGLIIILFSLAAANLLIVDHSLVIGDVGLMSKCQKGADNSSNVVTLWYRSPELLLGQRDYSFEVDMWSAGIVFVELMTGKTPLPGRDDKEQLDRIFRFIGTPNPSSWPGVDQLPGWAGVRHTRYPPILDRVFGRWDPAALDLLKGLLAPPHRRLTAKEALEHPFFTSYPRPSDPSR